MNKLKIWMLAALVIVAGCGKEAPTTTGTEAQAPPPGPAAVAEAPPAAAPEEAPEAGNRDGEQVRSSRIADRWHHVPAPARELSSHMVEAGVARALVSHCVNLPLASPHPAKAVHSGRPPACLSCLHHHRPLWAPRAFQGIIP